MQNLSISATLYLNLSQFFEKARNSEQFTINFSSNRNPVPCVSLPQYFKEFGQSKADNFSKMIVVRMDELLNHHYRGHNNDLITSEEDIKNFAEFVFMFLLQPLIKFPQMGLNQVENLDDLLLCLLDPSVFRPPQESEGQSWVKAHNLTFFQKTPELSISFTEIFDVVFFEKIKEIAESKGKNNPHARYILGVLSWCNLCPMPSNLSPRDSKPGESNVEISQSKAAGFNFFRKAAKQNSTAAQYVLALFYEDGNEIVKKDPSKALFWLESAACNNHVECLKMLGLKYENGIGVPQDFSKAFQYYSRAAELGEPSCLFVIGTMLRKGIGVSAYFPKALLMFEKSATLGNEMAQLELGIMFEKGKGCEKNPEKAFELFKKSSESATPVPKAQYKLALCYLKGKGAEKDEQKGIFWMEEAAKNKHLKAIYELALIYEKTYSYPPSSASCCPQNAEQNEKLEKAKNLLLEAAEMGFGKAKFHLAVAYEKGSFPMFEKNVEKAIQILKTEADAGNRKASFELGMLLMRQGNPKRAIAVLKKAAKKHHNESAFELGKYYHFQEQKEAKSKFWLQCAAINGHQPSKELLEKLANGN